MRPFPVISGVAIDSDEFGRFDLIDLHKASNADESKRPKYWLQLPATRALLKAINDSDTQAYELIAFAYAAWISPRFLIEVYQGITDYLIDLDVYKISRREELQLIEDIEYNDA